MIKLEIEALLKKRNRTKYWLVNKLDTSYPVINKFIAGETKSIQFDMLERIMYYLECTPEELINYVREDIEPPKR